MGKQGPCYHCGVTSTPLWRNGPPDKPVLCNACGSRWRTKGTLANYTPLHSRADPDDYDENRASRLKSMSINKSKEMKALKRKSNHDNVAMGGTPPDHYQGSRKAVDEDTSNRSSSGSAISNSESCAQFGSADASDLTGPAQSNVWDTTVPSRKRTCVSRPKQSPVEKLTKDLYNILHEQQSSYFSGSSEDDLLFESETPMVSVEIGHGSVLIRHPSSIAREEESEASSVSVENKQYSSNEAYSRSLPVYNDNSGGNFSSRCFEKSKNSTGHGIQPDQVKREKSQNEKPQILGNHKSPLCNIDLNYVLNFQEFMVWLTNEEQHQLLEFLPSVDKTKLPDSLKSMFDSLQFKENISSFQQLLAEGVFDLSFSGAKTEDCRTLQRLALSDMATSNWVGQYHSLKKCKNGTAVPADTKGSYTSSPNNVVNMKRSRDGQTHKFPEVKNPMKSPRRMNQKASYENRELIDSDSSCFSPKSLFALPTDGSSLMMEPLQFADESSDQDLLLDVPSNSSFPQAELLHPTSSFSQQASNSSSSAYPNLVRP